jgi:hypothetical protein
MLPRSAVTDVLALSAELTDQMHALLGRNTDGGLNATEKSELEALVRVAQVGQILSMSIQRQVRP